MTKWLIIIAILMAAMGTLLWQLTSPPKKTVAILPTFDAQPAKATQADNLTQAKQEAPPPTSPPLTPAQQEPAQYAPQSEEFSHQIDVTIPDTFRSQLARCDRQGMDPDAKINISYKLYIEDGIVSASNVRVEKSTLENVTLEECMVHSIEQARWPMKDMPDFQEEQDIFIRIRSLNKYLSPDEQKAAKAADSQDSEID